jgi:hypothetical protein
MIHRTNRTLTVTIAFSFLIAGILKTGNALAVHPDIHRHVTSVSETVYLDCLKQLGFKNSLKNGMNRIVMFSGQEDISPVLQRFFNWHFFDAYRDDEANAMSRHFTGARMSLHHIYNEHADDLTEALLNEQGNEVYELTGRLLHYIQDMTVPAHVAPIFHYTFVIFDRSDYFDGMPEWRTSSFTPKPDTCTFEKVKLADLKQQLNVILNKTALVTRDRIKEQIPVPENHPLSGKTWEEFWVLRKPEDDEKYMDTIKGFAPYGNQGRGGFERFCNGSDSERDACLSFFMGSYESAISSTVEMLLLINSIVQRK